MIPQKIIGLLSPIIPDFETHASINSLFLYAGAPANIPEGNKSVKVQEWLMACNIDLEVDEIKVLGIIVSHYLDEFLDEDTFALEEKKIRNNKIEKALEECGLKYYGNSKLTRFNSLATKSLKENIKDLNIDSINYEFERAIINIETDPYEAVSASCNILESVMKVFIEENDLDVPRKQDLENLWKIVKNELNLKPESIEDQDLKKILSGMNSIITGISALRTHVSSAHGRGSFRYQLKYRHVALAINSAHSLADFIIRTWVEKKK